MAFASGFLQDDSLYVDGDEVAVRVRLPWMRSLPFRSVRNLTFEVDGRPAGNLSLEVDGRRWGVTSLDGLGDGFWFVQRQVVLRGHLNSPPEPGLVVTLSVNATLDIPYIFTPTGQLMRVQPQSTRSLLVGTG